MNPTSGDPYQDLAAPRMSGSRARMSDRLVFVLGIAALLAALGVGLLAPPRALGRLDTALTPSPPAGAEAPR